MSRGIMRDNDLKKTKLTYEDVNNLFESSFVQLMFKAQNIHLKNFKEHKIQLSALCSIKTGGCPEDCAYCPQSAHFDTGLAREKLMPIEDILEQAIEAKKNGATRFCMGAAWKRPPKKEFNSVLDAVRRVKALGLETCVTLGSLTMEQACQLKEAGLDYYNHNLDTSESYYKKIITTRTYQERLDTLKTVNMANIRTCCGGIIGMGESRKDRIEFLLQLYNLPKMPDSIPINRLIRIQGAPLANISEIDNLEFVRVIAIARILMPKAKIRLSAGRENMTVELQALCFLAGANSIFLGEKLLTTNNVSIDRDFELLSKLAIEAE